MFHPFVASELQAASVTVSHSQFVSHPACLGLGDPRDPVHGGALDWLHQLRPQPAPVRAAPPGNQTLDTGSLFLTLSII